MHSQAQVRYQERHVAFIQRQIKLSRCL